MAKLKCNESKPCSRCLSRQIPCKSLPDRRRQPRPKNTTLSPCLSNRTAIPLRRSADVAWAQSTRDPCLTNRQLDDHPPSIPGFREPVSPLTSPTRNILEFTSDWSIDLNESDLVHLRELTQSLTAAATGLASNSPGACLRSQVAHRNGSESLDVPQSCRGRLLAFLFNKFKQPQTKELLAAFVYSSVLNRTIEAFIRSQADTECGFIHTSLYNSIDSAPICLLASAIAYGATRCDTRTLQKLGLILQDAVWTEISATLDRGGQGSPPQWLLQSLMCVIDAAFWSGHRQQMDESENRATILYRLLRRSGAFRTPKEQVTSVAAADTGAGLQAKWQHWIKKESFRRLAYRAYIFDAQVSFCLLSNPSIRYSEMSVELPGPLELWESNTAEEWQRHYLGLSGSNGQSKALSVADCIRDPMVLLLGFGMHDLSSSVLILLFTAWAMVLETLQLLSQTKCRPDFTHTTLAIRHRDVEQFLDGIHTLLSILYTDPCYKTNLLFYLVKMHLHICIEEVQIFAGREGPEAAARVLPLHQQWVQDQTSRQALWCAGQIIFAASSLPARSLRDFFAVAFYHAGICLWAYATVSQTLPLSSPAVVPQHDPSVSLHCFVTGPLLLLDGPSTEPVHYFLNSGQGQPAIRATADLNAISTDYVPIRDTFNVMKTITTIMLSNHRSYPGDLNLPGMVQNILRLLEVLGDV
ncbi:hypothetical protein ABZX51_008366 [Aspergillus tubingensis]